MYSNRLSAENTRRLDALGRNINQIHDFTEPAYFLSTGRNVNDIENKIKVEKDNTKKEISKIQKNNERFLFKFSFFYSTISDYADFNNQHPLLVVAWDSCQLSLIIMLFGTGSLNIAPALISSLEGEPSVDISKIIFDRQLCAGFE